MSSTPMPVAPGLADVVPDRRLRADVDAAGRVRGDQHLRLVAHLPADDELLLVAAGQRAGRHVDARACGRRTRRRCARCPRRAPRDVEQPALARWAARSGGRASGSPTAARPAAGRAGAGPPGCSRCRPRGAAGCPSAPMSVPASTTDPVDGAHAHDRLDQLGLAVALDAGDADDLAAVDRQGRRRRPAGGRSAVCTVRPRTSSTGVVGDGGLARLRAGQLAADHERGELPGGRPRRARTEATVVPRRITVIASATDEHLVAACAR